MPYQITDCRTLTTTQLCGAMNEAFADYVVPLSMSEQSFKDFQIQRGFSADHSFVATREGKVVSFWFSSLPNLEYEDRAYTLSVGTHPGHRRKGLSRKLLEAVIEKQRQSTCSGLQLEVVSTNTKAVTAYETFGFQCARKLRVCKLSNGFRSAGDLEGIDFKRIALTELPKNEADFFDTVPTPQNSRNAMTGLVAKTQVVVAIKGRDLLGWGAVYDDGVVAQIAVQRAFRGNGIGRGILNQLASLVEAEHLTFVNVDVTTPSINGFLDRAGAEDILQQFEMRLAI
ncbi:MAG: GNAT family N-acetyltransferase [Roseibium sp.]|uniref:GNAT family N-acetyltransferase n=1 Tax=Roseibium sp. TaxID=1936156 RepID=UPI002615D3FA|nr:GNAT family N-acetyltransferase [Roseibium sp.]MCV0428283.1 GNAT family N-acetyltransferase [Roseibium sp.]